uniref:Uncharacterized protein n=1 Tax=Zea mays TaxID=4577 RepID=B6T6J1_MAIZE|nr:hypothetical protein [Zea mays]
MIKEVFFPISSCIFSWGNPRWLHSRSCLVHFFFFDEGACCSSRGVGSSSTSTFTLIIMLPRHSHDLIRNFLSKDVCF